MIALSVNVNKIALIRNSRPGNNPDLVSYAKSCIEYGAQGITVHPRPDQRHIRAEDCYELKRFLADFPDIEFNIEGNPFAGPYKSDRDDVKDYPGFMQIIRDVRPHQVTLVPDNNAQLTSDHGFDLKQDSSKLKALIEEIQSLGCRVSLFMDADCEQLSLAKKIGAKRIEFYTGPYAEANDQKASFALYSLAAEHALSEGLEINAGHDLNLLNLPLFSELPGLKEVSIGHAITIDSLQYGLKETVNRYLKALS